jgi:hypothetical protein
VYLVLALSFSARLADDAQAAVLDRVEVLASSSACVHLDVHPHRAWRSGLEVVLEGGLDVAWRVARPLSAPLCWCPSRCPSSPRVEIGIGGSVRGWS